MGALLALLLGAAAGFVVLGISNHLLESVTTFTRLSRLMVYAEPPISPNDRNVLAVLAGVLTAGIGWVLVDWLLFGRAGMRMLIREREDDYEDEDGDSFRPTDPLDLVSPVSLPSGDWAPSPSGDTRRPLSARTDIGDPPKPSNPPGVPPLPMPGIDQLLPPIDQILPGVGRSVPPIHPGAPSPLIQPGPVPEPFAHIPQPVAGGVWGGVEAPPPHQPEPLPDQPSRPAASAGWLPTPGVRPDGSQPNFEVPAPPPLETGPVAEVTAPEPPAFPPAPPAVEPAPPRFIPPAPPPDLAFEPPPQPFAPPPLAFEPPFVAPPPPAFEPPPPTLEPPQPVALAPSVPTAPRPLPEPGFDKARLEDLLVRLERGLERRRAAAAARAAGAAPVVTAAPVPPRPEPVSFVADPPRAVPPAAFAAPRPDPFAFSQPVTPPAGYAAPQPVIPQPVMPTTAPIHELPPMPAVPTFGLTPQAPTGPGSPAEALRQPDAGQGDALLDQPLHVTLELLRDRVKR